MNHQTTSRAGLTLLLLAGSLLLACDEPPSSEAPSTIDPTSALTAPLEEIDMEWIALDENQVVGISHTIVHGKVIRNGTIQATGVGAFDRMAGRQAGEVVAELRQHASAAPTGLASPAVDEETLETE